MNFMNFKLYKLYKLFRLNSELCFYYLRGFNSSLFINAQKNSNSY
jgi:hypothetical protein